MRPAQTGFTLIELLVGISIIGILLTLGLPSITTFYRNSQIRTVGESILTGMNFARSEAVRRNETVTFTIGPAPDASWTVTDLNVVPAVLQAYSSAQGGNHAAIAATPAAATAVSFSSMGRICTVSVGSAIPPPPCTGGATFANTLSQIDIIAAAGFTGTDIHPLRVMVNDARGVRLCDPSIVLLATDARHC
jgi:type IV fimbrial biogenesis protein FimT